MGRRGNTNVCYRPIPVFRHRPPHVMELLDKRAVVPVFRGFFSAIRVPISPNADLGTLGIRSLRSNLAVLVKILPGSYFQSILVRSLRNQLPIRVEFGEESVTDPPRPVGRQVPSIAKSDFPGLIGDLRNS